MSRVQSAVMDVWTGGVICVAVCCTLIRQMHLPTAEHGVGPAGHIAVGGCHWTVDSPQTPEGTLPHVLSTTLTTPPRL